MVTQEKSLIRGVDDDGVIRLTGFIEKVEDTPQIVINRRNDAQIVFDVALVLEPCEFVTGQLASVPSCQKLVVAAFVTGFKCFALFR